MLVHKVVQVKSGICIRRMVGARHFMIVTMKLIPVMVLPTPLTSSAQIQ